MKLHRTMSRTLSCLTLLAALSAQAADSPSQPADAQGANLGWNEWEGNHPYPPDSKRDRGDIIFPVFEYSHDVGQSVTGGHVYRGKASPALVGTYLYGDFVAGWIGVARKTSAGSYEQRIVLEGGGVMPSSFGLDEQGEVYVCDYNGRLLRVSAR